MLDKHHETLSLRQQCTLLRVPRSNVYYKHVVTPSDTDIANEIHETWISLPEYGYRKVTAALRNNGHIINHKKVLWIMREMGIQSIYPKPKTTLRNIDHKTYKYHLKGLTITRSNQVWATDITYIKLLNGFMYLSAIIDVFSRRILAWRLSNT